MRDALVIILSIHIYGYLILSAESMSCLSRSCPVSKRHCPLESFALFMSRFGML